MAPTAHLPISPHLLSPRVQFVRLSAYFESELREASADPTETIASF